jgi:cob(I)alamin adenosyltransferase
LRVTAQQVARLESEIDTLNDKLEPLDSFVLPGGSEAAAYLHLARTLMRRAERRLSAAMEAGEQFSEPARQFINRASDLLFVAARVANENGKNDVKWIPGANR